MIKGKKIFAVIPARGGSKGLPGKNLRALGGKPLIAWSILAAQASKFVDRTIISSDDKDIIACAKEWRCEVPFTRPPELANDEAANQDVLLHALGAIEGDFDYVLLLQPTSPLRSSDDIDGCISWCLERNASSCISICESHKPPHWSFTMDANNELAPLFEKEFYSGRARRRQDQPKTFEQNGAVFMARVDQFLKRGDYYFEGMVGYVMPRERSLDIDDEIDFKMAEQYLSEPG